MLATVKYFLGLDLSLTSTGYCLMNQEGGILASGKLTPKKLSGIERLKFIEENLSSMVISHAVSEVFLEGYAFAAHMAYAHEIGELTGVIKLMLHRNGVPFRSVGPTTLKKFVTGRGNAKKNEMLLAIYKKWCIEFKDDNEADAYALARYGMGLAKNDP